MKHKNLLIVAAVSAILTYCATVSAQAPVVNIDHRRHGNLAAAQEFIVQAYQKMDRAQQANEDQLGGHAQKAKDLLTQADYEIRQAANVANENEHRR